MPLNGKEAVCREYHFDRGGSIGEFTSAVNGVGTVVYTGNHDKGVRLMVSDASDRAFIHWNGRLGFDIDNLLAAEFLVRLEAWDDTTDAVIGFGSAFNADPDAIQESVWFRIAGGTTGLNLSVETDDNVTNIDDEATGLVLPNNAWTRLHIDFSTGIQSISPPGVSKPGKSSIKFTASNDDGFQSHIRTARHMDMSGYAGGLQPIIGLRQLTSNASSEVYLYLKSLKVWSRQVA